MRFPRIWEPEEAIGSAWEYLVRDTGAEPHHPDAKVSFDEVKTSVGVIFRALSGDPAVEISGIAQDRATNRLSRRTRIVKEFDVVTHAQFDGQQLRLPASIDIFANKDLARGLYQWLAALAAFIDIPSERPDDPFLRDIAQIKICTHAENLLLAQCPGFAGLRERLGEALLSIRPQTSLPHQENELEKAIREILGSPGLDIARITSTQVLAESSSVSALALAGYKSFRPVALWPLILEPRNNEPNQSSSDEIASGSTKSSESDHILNVSRKNADQADRKDSFILHRFESILSMIDFLNINRKIDDDDDTNVKKAADDSREASFIKSAKSPKTKLKLHLDLAPQDVDATKLIGEKLYPEWNWKTRSYLQDYAHVEERLAEEASTAPLEELATRRQIEAVRRQFEALRPRRVLLRRQPDGHDLDIDEAIRARCDLLASGETTSRFYCDSRNNERDLAVSVLFDASRSTEAFIGERSVMDIGKEVLVALAEGITACGDQVSIHAFSSLKRERVMITSIKSFEDNSNPLVNRRIMSLTPCYYTRMGAAIRHISSYLEKRSSSRRLLLLITDGRPNDLDHYEGRYGIEDTRRAVMEARRLGHAVFGITIDAKAQHYVPYIFGPSGFVIIPNPSQLVRALPIIYSHITGHSS